MARMGHQSGNKFQLSGSMFQPCVVCGKEIENRQKHAKYCGKKCQDIRRKKMTKQYQQEGGMIGRNTRGTVNELLVASDLLKRGYEVFRAECPACSCDLIILNNLKPYRVEVRTGYKVEGSINLSYAKLNFEKFDILAIVFDGAIRYEPQLP